jgi:hypothetical protein
MGSLGVPARWAGAPTVSFRGTAVLWCRPPVVRAVRRTTRPST